MRYEKEFKIYYSNIDPAYNLYQEKENIKKLKGEKIKLAKEIARKIYDEKDFQKLFEGELNFLLKSQEGMQPLF